MGLFDKVLGGRSSESNAFSKQEAFAAIMLATVAADGHISDEEVDGFYAVINRMKLFKVQPVAEHKVMMDTHAKQRVRFKRSKETWHCQARHEASFCFHP